MPPRLLTVFLTLTFAGVLVWLTTAAPVTEVDVPSGPVRVLFLGHESEQHPSDEYFPMLAQTLGPDAIYFDYVTTPEEAFGDADWLARFDAVLLYANHQTLERSLWENLDAYVEGGGGFVPVHCASWCIQNIPEFDQLVGGRFKEHQSGIFTPKTIAPGHPAMRDLPALEAWDETDVHEKHNEEGRTVLQVREVEGPDDNITQAEPWTWVRHHGKGRVFYTASGHDESVWDRGEFHQLLKQGILWAVGDERRSTYESFLADREPLRYEVRDNIPNYEKRPEPLPWQFPLSPEESLKYTRAPMGFRLELFASEPDIINPICLVWDERGRLWVAETLDYPNEVRPDGGNDRIKILEDTDGDGRADKITIFADGLNIPTSLTFSHGGVIVAQAPDFLFLKDTDGDDVADERREILTGWGTRDTHAGPSNLRYGFDNRIWGTVGYSSFSGMVEGQELNFGSGVYSLESDGSDLRFLHQFNNNTWGLGFLENGDVFGSTANNNPSFFGGIPQTIYEEKRMSARMIANSTHLHPITPRIRQVDALGSYTAGCGHAFATSAAFPESYRNVAFVNGPTGNLTGMYRVREEGSGYEAKNAFAFVASADEWFSPVAAEVGPDGHLWIADWYNFIIQHNPAPTSERAGYNGEVGIGNAHVNPNRDKQHGRIYRVIWEGAPEPAITSLEGARTEDLVEALRDSNQFWRLTAQRLLVQEKHQSAVNSLQAMVRERGIPAIHALWTLEGLGNLDAATHQFALLSGDSNLQRNALKAIPLTDAGLQLLHDTALVASDDLHVRREALARFAAFPDSGVSANAATELLKDQTNREDDWLYLALKALGGADLLVESYEFGPNLLPNPSFEEVSAGNPVGWQVRTYRGDPERVRHAVVRDPKIARTGERALVIASPPDGKGHDTSFHTDLKLKKQTDYRLSGWIKTQAVRGAQGALLNVHAFPARTQGLSLGNRWTQVEVFFNTEDREHFSINCLFGGWGTSIGTAYYDDLSLQEATPVFSEQEAVELVGDLDRGREIFYHHQAAACIRCHMVDGQGGPIGPPLDGIASRKDESYLRESMSDPQATIAEGFQMEVSPMPPMNVILSPREYEDVMSYLLSLE